MPPFPPVGPMGRFPTFTGTLRALRRPGPFPPRFVAFAWQYHAAFVQWRPEGLPGSWMDPDAGMPCSWTPEGPGSQASTAPEVLPSAPRTASAPSTRALSGLDYTACPLAVYASRPGISPDPCKTRFRLVANRCRVGFGPTRSTLEGFEDPYLISSSFTRFSLARTWGRPYGRPLSRRA
jgi:hypothetical protein